MTTEISQAIALFTKRASVEEISLDKELADAEATSNGDERAFWIAFYQSLRTRNGQKPGAAELLNKLNTAAFSDLCDSAMLEISEKEAA